MAASGRDRAYEFLKDTYISSPQHQGRFINEQEVADRIGVSRTPIREALFRLAAEELVQLIPKRGAYIAPVTGRELNELMELRGMVERHAAHKTLASGSAPVDRMRAALERQAELSSPEQAREFIDWDHRFHSELIAATRNDLLIKFYDGLRERQVRAGMAAMFSTGDRYGSVLREHRAILDALDAGDGAAADVAIGAHLDATLRVLLDS
ncbi:DNA-binding GntR family transcriptional regulator [Spinactinospora alkalitolerans]|uniref:DNA-binding GntR family transcriptional regulator n=1 Tax=Spinactinospora alkalitolerans TaxID=687207 RepID=A0A852TUP0_9ACTN|nr:GntR family transcriptional regulator [Spinactinospora alkalitolerans]NYE46503.1 DNA-binding GntR family transcriptional regulator [Spinactinospora alkalitolerans]